MEDSSYAAAPEAGHNPDELKEDATAVKGLPASLSKDEDMATERVTFSSSPVLDLSQRGLCHLGEFFKIPNLQQLHLQRNALCGIPKDFFQLLPNLKWLDLRYNRIRALPSGIGSHKKKPYQNVTCGDGVCRVLKFLPSTAGHVTTLTALNLRHCPLEFPPQLIIQKGLVAILTFLRICSMEHTFPGDEAPQEVSVTKKMSLGNLPYPVLALPQDAVSSEEGLSLPTSQVAEMKQKADFFPPVERLDLSELCKSSDSSEHWPSEEEIKRFWKLRQEIVENEKVEVLEKKLLALELPPNLRAALNAKERGHRKPGPALRRKTTSFKGILPNLPSSYQTTIRTKRLEDSRVVALQELREKQMLMEQRKRDKRALQQWREQTQLVRKRRELSAFQPSHRNMMASKMPFATDLIDHGKMPTNSLGNVIHSRGRLAPKSAEMSASPLAELEEKIRQHTQQIHARRSFLSANPLRDMKMANQDLDAAKKLQDEVRKLKLEMTLNREHPFAAFTGNLSFHPPASQLQNIFFNPKY